MRTPRPACDLLDQGQIEQLFKRIGEECGRLDVLVDNVGMSSSPPSATDTPMLRQEAVEGGNTMQFQTPPQQPSDVVAATVSMLDKPRLEAYAGPRELFAARLAMLLPDLLPEILPRFRKRGDAGTSGIAADVLRLVGRAVVCGGPADIAQILSESLRSWTQVMPVRLIG